MRRLLQRWLGRFGRRSRVAELEAAGLQARMAQVENERDRLQSDLDACRDQLDAPGGPAIRMQLPAAPHPVTAELVDLADRMVDLTRPQATSDAARVAALARWMASRVPSLLALCDVTPIHDTGRLDARRHQVVATRTAPEPSLVDQIAETVRPGYMWGDEMLRPQQVIAYVPAPDRWEEGAEV